MPGRPVHHFNEAAAYHCGKRAATRDRQPSGHDFNEAAAYHCGKLAAEAQRLAVGLNTSMRPQHITAENGASSKGRRRRTTALQ